MNYEKITTCDVANGEGVGVVLWVSGCDVCCIGCHNKETWDPSSGKVFDWDALNSLKSELKKEHITRLTISGGHPLMPCNRDCVRTILQIVNDEFPDITIWLYTGYEYNNMDVECKYICDNLCDVIVEGPYIDKNRDLSLPFMGSSNQRIRRNKRKGHKVTKSTK